MSTTHTADNMSTAEWLDWKIEQGTYSFAARTKRLEFEAEVAAEERDEELDHLVEASAKAWAEAERTGDYSRWDEIEAELEEAGERILEEERAERGLTEDKSGEFEGRYDEPELPFDPSGDWWKLHPDHPDNRPGPVDELAALRALTGSRA